MARRDEHALTGRRHRQADGEILVIALLDHHRDDDRAQRGNVRHGGAGDAAEEHRIQHVHVGQTAAEAADRQIRQIDNLFGNAARAHKFAHHDEKRNREQREVVRTIHHLPNENGEVRARDQRAAQRREQHRKGNRHPHQQQEHKSADQNQTGQRRGRHFFSASFAMAATAASSVKSTSGSE